MKMIPVKIADLTGPALDWAVATIALGLTVKPGTMTTDLCVSNADGDLFGWISTDPERRDIGEEYSPSTDWSQGGPLIDQYDVFFARVRGEMMASVYPCLAMQGENRLVAAMRAIVVYKAERDTVEVPAELVGGVK